MIPTWLMRSAAIALVSVVALPAQNDSAATELGGVLYRWAEAYDRHEFGSRSVVRGFEGDHSLYGSTLRRRGVLKLRSGETLTHVEAVQRLILTASSYQTPAVHEGLLRLAAVGLDRKLTDTSSRTVRDAAHWALMRSQNARMWPIIMRAANGYRTLSDIGAKRDADDETADEDLPVLPAVQVAALRLLGQQRAEVFRGTIEGRLAAGDARVRLAAAEAIGQSRQQESLPVVSRALATERHPVVAQALVRTLERILDQNGAAVPPERLTRAIKAALRVLGKAGWRTDMAIVKLADAYPLLDAIPALIAVMERASAKTDKLRDAVNREASPTLKHRAWVTLRRLTGAILPLHEPDEWRQFWETERHNIRIPKRQTAQPSQPRTQSAFYGIPIVGREIAFIVDTSGSMKADCDYGNQTRSQRRVPSRLDVAKEQVLNAVQAIDSASKYHLFTFADEVMIWNERPVPPMPSSLRSLTRLFGRLRPDGGTNLADALEYATAANEQVFGQITNNRIDEIFVVSDGEPSVGMKDPEAILEMVRDANQYQKIRISTVFAGDDESGADLLRRLAEQNDGVFVQIR